MGAEALWSIFGKRKSLNESEVTSNKLGISQIFEEAGIIEPLKEEIGPLITPSHSSVDEGKELIQSHS